jgi:hypothetical protein
VDVVPVLTVDTLNGQRYLLAGGSDTWKWRAANPKHDQLRLTEQDEHHGGLLLPTIRVMKAWNDFSCGHRLKSVHLEVLLACYVFKDVEIDSVVSGVVYALANLPTHLEHTCPDPTGLGYDLDISLHTDDRAWVRERAARDAQRFQLALAGTLDPAEAAQMLDGIIRATEKAKPDRKRTSREPWHNQQFGQPAADRTYGLPTVPVSAVPAAMPQQRLQRPPDRSRGRGEYA